MRKLYTFALLFIALPFLSFVFYSYDLYTEVDSVFLSISTFLFSIFTGFFISRQASRFNRVRETVTRYDGLLSGIYRSVGHVSLELQNKMGKIIYEHYTKILESKQWHVHFTQKSTTLTRLHKALEDEVKDEGMTKLSNQALGATVKGLSGLQDVRKQMVALYKERIPLEQWVLILFFGSMLIGVASIMPSAGLLFPSIVKAAFVVSVLSVLFILYRLNNLAYTERIMGEESARDVLGIIDGTK